MEKAILSGEDVNAKDLGSFTALHWAARKGHLAVVAVLVAHKADINKKNKHGKTPLDFAKEYEHQSIIKFFNEVKLMLGGRKQKTTPVKRTRVNSGQSGGARSKPSTPQVRAIWPKRAA